MKKWIACILIVTVCCSLFGCLAGMTAVESFLVATGKMDLTAMRAELVPDETTGSLYRKLQNTALTDGTITVLRDLYALVHYTIGEVSAESNGEKTVSVALRVPDMERIRSLVSAELLVSGDSAEKILGNMIAAGTISQNMMKEYTISVKMTKSDSVWKIPYGDKANADLAKALALAEMIDFMI